MEKVTMLSPDGKETREVDPTDTAALVPLMVAGWKQVTAEKPQEAQ